MGFFVLFLLGLRVWSLRNSLLAFLCIALLGGFCCRCRFHCRFQEQQTVTRYDDDTFGTFGKHYFLTPPTSRYPTGMCQYWCDANGDIQPNEEESLESYDYENRAKYDSSTTYVNGMESNRIEWNAIFFFFVFFSAILVFSWQ